MKLFKKVNYKDATHIVHAYNDDDNGEQFHIKPYELPTEEEIKDVFTGKCK